MVANVVQSGTTSALTIGSETQLFAGYTTAGTYFIALDTSNLQNGDELELRIYVKIGGTELLYILEPFSHIQAQPAKISVGIPTPTWIRATLKQTAGTGRTFKWEQWGL